MEVVRTIEDNEEGGAILDLSVDAIELRLFTERGLQHLQNNLDECWNNLTTAQIQFLAETGINAALKDHIEKIEKEKTENDSDN